MLGVENHATEAGGDPVIQVVVPKTPVVELVQRTLPAGAAVVLVVQRQSAVAKYVDAMGVERHSMPFGDHVSMQEALVVSARAGRSHITETKILESVRDCVAQVRAAESPEAAMLPGFQLLAKHTMSHYAMRRLRGAMQEERDRRLQAEERADTLSHRMEEAELLCEEGGSPDEILAALRGE